MAERAAFLDLDAKRRGIPWTTWRRSSWRPLIELNRPKRAVRAIAAVTESALAAERDSMASPEHVAIVAGLIAKSG